jgi:hypothetical protein
MFDTSNSNHIHKAFCASFDAVDMNTGCNVLQRRAVVELALKIVNGRVEVYEDGAYRHSYGSHIEDAATDGNIVAVVTGDGRIEEYRDGMCQRSYGSNAKKVRISGNTLAVTLKDGRIAEFENGMCRRMY